MLYAKICGISDSHTLRFILKHKYPPKFIGFITNWKKSIRYIQLTNLKKLLNNISKKKIKFVAVLVKPKNNTLNKINQIKNLEYLQLYDVAPKRTLKIKKKYKKKIITALTIKKKADVLKYKNYINISDIILFDGKGYEKSINFDHSLIQNLELKSNIMIAGNIKYNEQLDKYLKIADIIDLSGSLETFGKKDINKIDIFLKNLKKVNDKNKKKRSIN